MQTKTPNGATLKVAFKHDHFTDPKQGKKRGRAITLCYITLLTDFGAASIIGHGMSRCAWEDRSIFTKEEGRRRALRKATEGMDPILRGLAMKAYFERQRVGK